MYNTILAVAAAGETTLSGIAQKAMLDARTVSIYLSRLAELGVVQRELSVGVGEQERTKPHRGLWRVSDNYIKFWFGAVRPNLSELDVGDVQGVWTYAIQPRLNDLLSWSFEDVCRQWVQRRNMAGELPFRCRLMGRWWKGAEEIDVVAVGEGGARILGECKFRNGRMGGNVLEELRAKQRRSFARCDCWLYLFSKEGFEEALEQETSDRVRVVSPGELES